MSDIPISSMNYKELRNEVQLLRDELALMKRKYEDILYNLDLGNFSSSFIKEQDGMKTQIAVTAEGIQTVVSDVADIGQRVSTLAQTAEGFQTEVEDIKANVSKNASSIQQTAEAIETKVSSEDLQSELEDKLKNYSTTTQTDSLIRQAVTQEMSGYATEDYVIGETSELNRTLSSQISQTADKIALIITQSGDAYVLNSASIIAAINDDESNVTISADKITFNGDTEVYGKIKSGEFYTNGIILYGTYKLNGEQYNDVPFCYLGYSDEGKGKLVLRNITDLYPLNIESDEIIFEGNIDLSEATITDWGDNAPSIGSSVAVFG